MPELIAKVACRCLGKPGFQSLDEIQPRFAAIQVVLLKRPQGFGQQHVIGVSPKVPSVRPARVISLTCPGVVVVSATSKVWVNDHLLGNFGPQNRSAEGKGGAFERIAHAVWIVDIAFLGGN